MTIRITLEEIELIFARFIQRVYLLIRREVDVRAGLFFCRQLP